MENRFTESSYYRTLREDIASGYRRTGHALDNYGIDMPKELREALDGLYRAQEAVLDAIREEMYAKD